jgi:hypothetical protein
MSVICHYKVGEDDLDGEVSVRRGKGGYDDKDDSQSPLFAMLYNMRHMGIRHRFQIRGS